MMRMRTSLLLSVALTTICVEAIVREQKEKKFEMTPTSFLEFEPPISQNSFYKEYYQNVINDDDLVPDQCTSGPTYLTNPPGGMDLIEEQEKCSLCSTIVKNRFKWNWRWHYSALCTGVPEHLMDLCRHYACKLTSQCPEFITGTCAEGGQKRFPCPSKYICWNCLHVPEEQYVGCFDSDIADMHFGS